MSLHERGGIGVIEADETVGESLVQRLELEGYSPLWWQTGRAALDQLPKAGPDLVICDTLLPDMSGKDVLLGALPELGGKPFLFVTAHAQVEDAVYLMKAGAVDYLEKPYELSDLLDRIARLIKLPPKAAGDLGTSEAMRQVEMLLRRVAALLNRTWTMGSTASAFCRRPGRSSSGGSCRRGRHSSSDHQ